MGTASRATEWQAAKASASACEMFQARRGTCLNKNRILTRHKCGNGRMDGKSWNVMTVAALQYFVKRRTFSSNFLMIHQLTAATHCIHDRKLERVLPLFIQDSTDIGPGFHVHAPDVPGPPTEPYRQQVNSRIRNLTLLCLPLCLFFLPNHHIFSFSRPSYDSSFLPSNIPAINENNHLIQALA